MCQNKPTGRLKPAKKTQNEPKLPKTNQKEPKRDIKQAYTTKNKPKLPKTT